MILTIGCDSTPPVPQGFTPEGWARLKREEPRRAELIVWAQKKAGFWEASIKSQKILENAGFGGPAAWNDTFIKAADAAMISGKPLRKTMLEALDRYKDLLKAEQYSAVKALVEKIED